MPACAGSSASWCRQASTNFSLLTSPNCAGRFRCSRPEMSCCWFTRNCRIASCRMQDSPRATATTWRRVRRPPKSMRFAWSARLAGDTGARVHIVHVSSAGGVDAVEEARSAGVRITAETCPHYLTFSASEVPDGATEYKCAPPIRDDDDREALWRGLRSGALQMVASDHSPAPPAHEMPRRLCPRVGRDRVDRARAGGGLDGSSCTRIRCRGHRAMDERGAGRARRPVRTQRPDRAGLRCRPRGVGSGPGIHGRRVASCSNVTR